MGAIKRMTAVSATFALALSASIGGVQAAPLLYNIGANFTFAPSGDMTASPNGTADTISEPATNSGRGSETAILNSNFAISGNFTASVQQGFTTAPNAGSQEVAAFEVVFGNGGETVQYVIINAFGQPVPSFWNGSLTPGIPNGAGVGPLTGHINATLQVQRTGNTVTLGYDGTNYFSITDPLYGGDATFLLYFGNGLGNPGAGAVTWDNFTITTEETPLPAALPLFATGLGVLGLLGRRRKRRAVQSAH